MSIVEHIATDNPDAAISQGDEIHGQIVKLKCFPERGRSGRVRGTLELVIQRTPYVAAYRIKANQVQILRILHSSRLWPTSL